MRRVRLVSAPALFLLAASALGEAQTSEPVSDARGPEATDQPPRIARVANDATPAPLEEVVVTATRRSQPLQDVPLSVTAFSQETLSEKGIVGYEGLALETPGAVINRPTQNFNNFSVRGISTNGYGAGLQSTVQIYIDELPISANGNSTILDPNLYDVERVEFLRGPQGTLFGSNSLAGAVRILTRNPELDRFDASARVDLGSTRSDALRQRYDAMVNVPLIDDRLALRVVGFYRDEEGYLDNVGTGVDNSNELIDQGGRAILLWEPADRLSVRLMAYYEDSEPEDSSLTSPTLGSRTRISDRPDLFHAELSSYNATIRYDFGGAELTSSSTYSTYDQLFVVDLGGTFDRAIAFGLDALAYDDIFVEEIRLVSESGRKFDWVIGGFYHYKRRDVDFNYRSTPEFLTARGITGLDDEYYQRFGNHTKSHEKAVFGELTYNVSDSFWLTAGIRYSSADVQTFTEPGGYNSNYLTMALLGLSGPLTITEIAEAEGDKGKERGPSYKISASYKPIENLTAYATYSTGFRTPAVNGFAGRPSLVDPNDLVIPDGADSDELDNYELGLKGTWFGNRLRANLALYWIDWRNIQVQANRVSDSVQFATNIGKARSRGFEFEISATPLPGLDIGLNGSVTDAEVISLTDSEAAISGAVDGAELAFPDFAGSLYVRYERNVGPVRGFASASLQHVGSFPSSFPNVPGNPSQVSPIYGETDTYNNVNLTLGAHLNERLTVTGYVENVFDDDSITYIHPEAFITSRFGTLRPRTVGVRVNYHY